MVLMVRCLWWAIHCRAVFQQFAVVGLVTLVGLQAFVNMGVNVGLLPATGMTLPLISAGGSSMLGVAISFGLILALMRADGGHDYISPPQPAGVPEEGRGRLEGSLGVRLP